MEIPVSRTYQKNEVETYRDSQPENRIDIMTVGIRMSVYIEPIEKTRETRQSDDISKHCVGDVQYPPSVNVTRLCYVANARCRNDDPRSVV
ncbi:unnamed protein product [Somion occarium]|uniref:Uncharacterized protein n=1 Tax=Somion occarium TaxID=3059160 RepID=A0ABP1E0W0_9APHY